jgi:ribose 5-phosphate isomerase A
MEPIKMEQAINNITSVVAVGLFAMRPADVVLVSDGEQIVTF